LKTPADSAYALDALGQALLQLDRLPESQRAFEEALKLREAVGWAGGASRQNLAEVALAEGKLERAEALAQKAVDEQHSKHMGLAEAYSRTVLAEVLFEEGKTTQAAQVASDAEALVKAAGSSLAEAGAATTMARVQADRGDVAGACRAVRAEIARTAGKGLMNISLWSRWSLAQIEAEHHVPTVGQTLRELEAAAKAHHFFLLARQASTLAHKLRTH